MKIMKKAFAMFVAVFTLLATLCMVPVSAATTVAAQLYGRIEDNGQAIYKMVLDYGNVKVSGVDKDTLFMPKQLQKVKDQLMRKLMGIMIKIELLFV